jgi:hypothetical protein
MLLLPSPRQQFGGNKESTAKVGVSSGVFVKRSVGLSGYVLIWRPGDILSELQDGAGLDIGHSFQRGRAEDKGDLQVFVIVILSRGLNL